MQGGGGAGVPGKGELQRLSIRSCGRAASPQKQPLTHSLTLSLCASLRQSVRASQLQGFGRIEDGRCSKESTALLHRPSTLPVCRRLETIV